MKAIDQVLVEGQGEQFALLAPEVINDYVETLGKPCQNPLGYTAGSLILAKDLEGVQRMFKVTANISSSQNVVEGTNVERKKLEDLFDGIEEEIGDVDQELGSVKQALSDLEENLTEKVASGDAYTFRQGKGTLVDMSLVGGTVAWNQLVQNGNFASTSNWSAVTANVAVNSNVITITPTARYGCIQQAISRIKDHKYLMTVDMKLTTASDLIIAAQAYTGSGWVSKNAVSDTNWHNYSLIFNQTTDDNTLAYTRFGQDNRTSDWDSYNLKNAMIIDLTQMFGSTIADYIYSLEQATAGAGVAWFRELFSKAYYAYDEGSLQSVKPSGRLVRGFNLWDEQWESGLYTYAGGEPYSDAAYIRSKNFIRVIPNTDYYIKNASGVSIILYKYDANKKFISYTTSQYNTVYNVGNAEYLMIAQNRTVYNNDICINISKTTDSPNNGDYEPYCGMVYPFPSIDLRGIPKLVDNKLAYDGDSYKADGSVTRKYKQYTFTGSESLTQIATTTSGWYQYAYAPASPNQMPDRQNVIDFVSDYGEPILNSSLSDITIDKVYVYRVGTGIRFTLNVSTTAQAQALLAGKTIVYELATPTTETASPFINPERSYLDGTEEWIEDGTRDVVVPVGNNSEYYQNETYSPIAESSDSVLEFASQSTQKLNLIDYFSVNATSFNINSNVSYLYKNSNTVMLQIAGYTNAGITGTINIGRVAIKPKSTILAMAYSYDGTASIIPSHLYYDGDISLIGVEGNKNYEVYFVFSV